MILNEEAAADITNGSLNKQEQVLDTFNHHHNQEQSGNYSRTVLLVLDESFASQYALRWTIKHFMRPSAPELLVLVVMENVDAKDEQDEDGKILLEKYASFTIDQFKGRQDCELSVNGLVLRGNDAGRDKLLKKAEKMGASSIILGCTGKDSSVKIGRDLQNYLAEYSKVPLVLIRAPFIKSLHIHPALTTPPVGAKESSSAAAAAAAASSLDSSATAQLKKQPQLAHDQEHSRSYECDLPRDRAVQAEINSNPEWFLGQEMLALHPKRKQAKTAERYLRIRNFILDEWYKDTSRFLTKTSARRGLLQREGDVNAIGRVFDFLQGHGYINCGHVRSAPVSDRKRKASTSLSGIDEYGGIGGGGIGNGNGNGVYHEKLPKIESPFQKNLETNL